MSQERKGSQPKIAENLPDLVRDTLKVHGDRLFHRQVDYAAGPRINIVENTQTPLVEIEGGNRLVLLKGEGVYALNVVPPGQQWNREILEFDKLAGQGRTVMRIHEKLGGDFVLMDSEGNPLPPHEIEAAQKTLAWLKNQLDSAHT